MIANENLEKERRIDLEISVKNFGPIIGGEVKLRPLTVLIRPNNSGKSYVAMLFHSLFESVPIPLSTAIVRRIWDVLELDIANIEDYNSR